MSNEEQLLGFDIREMWLQMDVTWPESRKAIYLLRADVTKVLSVDSHVWPRAVLGVEKNVVLPLLVVDNSNFSPSRLTFPHDALYSSFSEGDGPLSSFQTQRILHEPTYVLVLPHALSRAALCRVLVPSWFCPAESSSQDTHQAPPSAQTALPT
jgi:hypothetical protein